MDQIPVIMQTPHFAIVAKPAKWLMHRSYLSNHDTEFLLQRIRDQLHRRVWPVSRLDRGASGCVIFAFSSEVAARLRILQANGGIEKRYWAVCRGFTPEELMIDHPLRPPIDPYLRVQKTALQQALTYLKRLATAEIPIPYEQFPSTRLSLNELKLGTGRRHQIRKHLKWISHPIIGDSTYGKGKLNRDLAEYFGEDRLLLHCRSIEIRDFASGFSVTATAPLDNAFRTIFIKSNWDKYLR